MAFKFLAKTICFSIPIGMTIWDRFAQIWRVKGASMEPTLNPPENEEISDYVLMSRYNIHNVHRGDIVVFRSPLHPGVLYVKRITAMQGDIICNRVFPRTHQEIPPGCVWVEGDNELVSYDSNNFGPIPIGLIYGKVEYIVWPLSRMQSLKNTTHMGYV